MSGVNQHGKKGGKIKTGQGFEYVCGLMGDESGGLAHTQMLRIHPI